MYDVTRQFPITLLELIRRQENKAKFAKISLGGGGGAGGGSGTPPGGYDGQLAQRYVAYDTTEAVSSGSVGGSGSVACLVDNLNRIRANVFVFNDSEGYPANISSAVAYGTSNYAPRRDHVHTVSLAPNMSWISGSLSSYGSGGVTGTSGYGMYDGVVRGATIGLCGTDYVHPVYGNYFGFLDLASDIRNADSTSGRIRFFQYDGSNYNLRGYFGKTGGFVSGSSVAGGDMGLGTVNVSGNYYINGVAIGGGGDISGTGVVGQVAEFVTNTKTIQAAKIIGPVTNILTITNSAASTLALAITSAKTLTLTATDDYNLTIPATGTAALLTTVWTLVGNAGTTVSTNFIGTTDAVAFAVKTKGNVVAWFGVSNAASADGNARGWYAVDLQATRNAVTQVASGTSSVVLGGANNTASQTYSTVLGGFNNNVSGTNSVAMGRNQTVSGNYSTAVGGNTTVTHTDCFLFGDETSAFASVADYEVAIQARGGFRHAYNASNYWAAQVSSAGAVTFDATGASAGFAFLDTVTINKNAATLPAPPSGTVLHMGQANSVNSIYTNDSFASYSLYALRRAQGTAASPTVINASLTLGAIVAYGYHGSGYGIGASVDFVSTGAFTGSVYDSKMLLRTTKGTTLTTAVTIDENQAATFAGTVTVPSPITIGTGTLALAAAAFSLLGGGASCTLTLPNAATSITGGGTLAMTAAQTYTFPATGGTVALLNAANSFTLINPLTTIAESWIGPSSTAGIYFKGGNVGVGTTAPSAPLEVASSISSTSVYGVALFRNTLNNVDTNPTVAYPVASFVRSGKVGVTFDSTLQIGISRYEAVGSYARTQADFLLSNGNSSTGDVIVLSMRSNGVVTIPALAGTGVRAVTADANGALNCATEGTITVTLTCGTSGTITLDHNTLAYTKIGKLVVVTGYIHVSGVSSPVGGLILNGLPHTCTNGLAYYSSISARADGLLATATTAIQGYVIMNSTTASLEKYAAGATSNTLAGDVQAGASFIFTIIYFTT